MFNKRTPHKISCFSLAFKILLILLPRILTSETLQNTTYIEVSPSFSLPEYVHEICDEGNFNKVESWDKLLKDIDRLEALINFLIAKKTRSLDTIEMVLNCIDKMYIFALEKFPDEVEVYDEYGAFLYDYKKDIINAVKIWERGYAISPESPSINNNLAMHYFHFGEYEKGWHFLQNALKYGEDDPNILYNLAQIYFLYRYQIQAFTGWSLKKIYEDGMNFSKRSAELAPNDFEILKDYALNFFVAFQFNQPFDGKSCVLAWQKARKVARNNDEVFHTWVNEARAWLAIGKLKDAKKCLTEALKIKPDSEIVKDILKKIESGEIEGEIKSRKLSERNYSKQRDSDTQWIPPRKNFNRKTTQNPLYRIPSFYMKGN